MALSSIATELAAGIKKHRWAYACIPSLGEKETEFVRLNAIWVTAQVLAHNDPNFDAYEFARACGADRGTRRFIESGLRGTRGDYDPPGQIHTRGR